ncbi:major facilitator superfamily domain-containing protein [Thelonectria olida]|uniref:Major facilitator superfamily domain-containing protein n=1 Tax=Thelonectria olida TaxID=1576542 RepID=A0A9P8VMM1_9HYPO|nr:major facilitator superfamily domain-containing protein [Thelonectria olida]
MRQQREASSAAVAEAPPPFPTRQMLVLALCRLCEPIAFTSIFPYIYFMIQDFHETDDPNQISTYAGMMTTAFAIAEFSTGAIWGRVSDKVGRKPVILIALFGTAFSMLLLGFSPSILTALLSRVLAGLLNGNISVMQTVVGEIITVKEHQARAYMVMPLVWGMGSIIGPMVGGALARPCISYPNIFPQGSIWDRWPYLLPNLCCAILLVVGASIGALFMEETNPQISRRDPALEVGNWISSLWSRPIDQKTQTTQTGPARVPRAVKGIPSTQGLSRPSIGSSSVFNRQVLLNIASYGILAFHTMTFDQLFPMVLSTESRADRHLSWPFKFVDGYGMDTKEVGFVLSVQGIYSLFATACLFPFVVHRVGSLRLYQLLAVSYWALYVFTPYAVLLPDSLKTAGVYAILLWRCSFSSMAYPANAILLINAVTDKTSLGTINGIAASTASLCRAFSPAVSGYLYTVGLETGYSGLAWWVNGAITVSGSIVSLYLMDYHTVEPEERGCDEETALLGGPA